MRSYPILAAIIVAFVAAASPALADQSSQDEWQTTITPYVWLPTIHGQLNFLVPTGNGQALGPPVGITVTPSKYVPKLGSAFMFAGETKNSHWGIGTDLIYLNLFVNNAGVTNISGPGGKLTLPINTNVNFQQATTLWTIDAVVPVIEKPRWEIEGLAGGRYLYAPIRLSWNFSGPLGLLNASGQHYQSASVWDAIVGAKGHVNFGDGNWFIPIYGDVGTGEAHLTWQAYGGFGYQFKHGQSFEAVYRNLYYDMGSQGLLNNINLGGPALGYTFKL